MPAIGPPWTKLVAYDLNQGHDQMARDAWNPSQHSPPEGSNTGSVRPRNGPVVTAGTLIFVASNGDRYIHAFDKDTGKIIWETEIEANPDGIPAVYEVGGRHYVGLLGERRRRSRVVIKPSKPEAQGYYIFALPNSDSKSKKKGN